MSGKLPKKFIKKYGISAKAWREYRKAKKAAAANRKKSRIAGAKKKTVKKKAAKKKVANKKPLIISVQTGGKKTMAKKKKSSRKKKRTGVSRRTLISKTTAKTLIDGSIIGLAALLSTMGINMLPVIKDQQSWIKALTQAAIGTLLVGAVKDQAIKKAGMGAISGGAITLLIPFMPDSFTFAGGREFSDDELLELQTMGVPVRISGDNDSMGVPVRIEESGPEMVAGNPYYPSY